MASRREWERGLIDRVRLADTVVVIAAVVCAQVVRFGAPHLASVDYTVVSVLLAGTWLAFLSIFRTRSPRVLGSGAE